ncbi:hypothetical protein D3C86_1855740 [compost metagenome]
MQIGRRHVPQGRRQPPAIQQVPGWPARAVAEDPAENRALFHDGSGGSFPRAGRLQEIL